MRTIVGILTLAFSLSAFVHFVIRVIRHRRRARRQTSPAKAREYRRASWVSLALAIVVLSPAVVYAVAHGVLPPRTYVGLEWVSLVIASALVVSILRVDMLEAQMKALATSEEEARAFLTDLRGEGVPPTAKAPEVDR